MLKRRIIPLLLWQDGRLVKTRQFGSPRIVGDLVKTCRVYSDQDADEILILNINKDGAQFDIFLEAIEKVSKEVMIPISIGGGIGSIEAGDKAFRAGADKVVVNSAPYTNPGLIRTLASRYGAQAVIASVDYRESREGIELWSNGGNEKQKTLLDQHLKALSGEGFGELLLQSIARDGMKSGYDLKTLSYALQLVTKPVIAAGGAGDFTHLNEAFGLGVDAVACGTLFNFGDNNPQRAKAFLRNYGVPLKKTL